MIVVDVCVFACFDDISGADIFKVVVQSNFWSVIYINHIPHKMMPSFIGQS